MLILEVARDGTRFQIGMLTGEASEISSSLLDFTQRLKEQQGNEAVANHPSPELSLSCCYDCTEDDAAEEDCPICLEVVHENDTRLACGHRFCTCCISRHFRSRIEEKLPYVCPCCRPAVKLGISHTEWQQWSAAQPAGTSEPSIARSRQPACSPLCSFRTAV